jgi:hypothetical protein
MRKVIAALAVCALVALAGAAVAAFASGAKIKTGDYEAGPVNPPHAGYTVGVFGVAKQNGKYKLVPSASEGGGYIYPPDNEKCGGDYEARLSGTTYPISKHGTFFINDSFDQTRNGHSVKEHIKWTGKWHKSGKSVGGRLTLSIKGKCRAKFKWGGAAFG